MNAHEDLLRKAKFDIEVGADGLWRIAGSKEDIKALSAVATSALAGAGDALVDSLDQMLAARWTLNDEPLPEDVAGVLRAVASRLAAPSKEPTTAHWCAAIESVTGFQPGPIEQAARALAAAPTGPQPAGGGVVTVPPAA